MKFDNIKPGIAAGSAVFWSKIKPFMLCMAILASFVKCFGSDNVFVGISLAMVLLTYRYIDIGIPPKSAAICLFCLFILIGFASWANQLGVWVSLPINFLTVYTLMMCTTMALVQKPYIPLCCVLYLCRGIK